MDSAIRRWQSRHHEGGLIAHEIRISRIGGETWGARETLNTHFGKLIRPERAAPGGFYENVSATISLSSRGIVAGSGDHAGAVGR